MTDFTLGPGPLTPEFEQVKSDIGIVENGNSATHAIPAGYYVIWKGDLYVAKTDISIGTALSTSNLTAKTQGIGKDLAELIGNVRNLPFDGDRRVVSDLNECKIPGIYNCTNAGTTNKPANGWYSCIVIKYSNTDLVQIAIEVNTRATWIRAWHDGTTWEAWQQFALMSTVYKYEQLTPTSFDTNVLSAVSAFRRGSTVQVQVTFKAGLSAQWHNDVATGLTENFRPLTAVYGCHRVNASADLSKNVVAILNTNGTLQMLNLDVFTADIPFVFTFVSRN